MIAAANAATSQRQDRNSHARTPLQGLVAECLRKRPEDRPAARSVVEALSSLAQGQAPPSEDVTPFRGLSTFSERHAELFRQ